MHIFLTVLGCLFFVVFLALYVYSISVPQEEVIEPAKKSDEPLTPVPGLSKQLEADMYNSKLNYDQLDTLRYQINTLNKASSKQVKQFNSPCVDEVYYWDENDHLIVSKVENKSKKSKKKSIKSKKKTVKKKTKKK